MRCWSGWTQESCRCAPRDRFPALPAASLAQAYRAWHSHHGSTFYSKRFYAVPHGPAMSFKNKAQCPVCWLGPGTSHCPRPGTQGGLWGLKASANAEYDSWRQNKAATSTVRSGPDLLPWTFTAPLILPMKTTTTQKFKINPIIRCMIW